MGMDIYKYQNLKLVIYIYQYLSKLGNPNMYVCMRSFILKYSLNYSQTFLGSAFILIVLKVDNFVDGILYL